MLNVVYITFIFGPQLPVLFPIALVSMCCMVVTERLMMAYCYTRPPMYDSSINELTIKLMLLAPLVYLLSASWQFSN